MSGDERQAERPSPSDMLRKAESGNSFTEDLNRMSPQEQMAAFRQMKDLQSQGQFQNIQLIDSNNDGRLDDATVKTANGRLDVYDNPQEMMAAQRQADRLLRTALNGNNISAQFNQLRPEEQDRVFSAMRSMVNRPEFANLQLREKDGKLSDLSVNLDLGRRGTENRDVYDTPVEARAKELMRNSGVIEDLKRGKVDRIPGRVGNEIERAIPQIFRRRN